LVIACGEGAIAIQELQAPGRKRIGVKQYVGGRPIAKGTLLT